MRRKSDVEAEYRYACEQVYGREFGDPQTSFWIGYRDALQFVIDTRVESRVGATDPVLVECERGEREGQSR